MKQHNDQTVKTSADEHGNLKYCCLYCEEWYHPKKRWVQKYCTPSCSVKACRERNVGFYGVTGGTLSTRRNATTNTELKNKLNEVITVLDIQQHKDKLDKDLDVRRRELEVKEINQNINLGFKKITNKLTWLMVISGIIPFIAGPIRRWVSKFFQKDKTEPFNAGNLKKKFEEDFLKKMPPDMQEKMKSSMNNIFDQIKSAMP